MNITPEQRALRYNGYFRRSAGLEDTELTHVGPGTPCGEYFRRFWLPVCMTEEVSERPAVVKALGEELVAFKDLSGTIRARSQALFTPTSLIGVRHRRRARNSLLLSRVVVRH